MFSHHGFPVLLAFCLALAAPARALELFVSPTGNDSWNGRAPEPTADGKSGPFATLERARDEARALAKAKKWPKKGLTVTVRGGDYFLGATFALGPEDSGKPGAPLVFRAREGEVPRLSGGREVGGWKLVSDPAVLSRLDPAIRAEACEADLTALGIADAGVISRRGFGVQRTPAWPELFFNDVPQTLARYPNDEWLTISALAEDALPVSGPANVPADSFFTAGKDGSSRGFITSDPRPRRWASFDDVWMHGYWAFDWADTYERIASYNPETGMVASAEPPAGWYGFRKDRRFYFENVLEELDTPGEYYVDRKNGTLYFIPPSPVSSGRAFVSALAGPVVSLDGASNVSIEGFTIEHGRGAGVSVRGGAYCRVAGCTVRNVGTVGILVDGGRKHSVVSCDIYATGEDGVSVTGGIREKLIPGGHEVVNCHIHDYSRLCRTYHPAVQVGGVGQRVANCLIHDAPHNAILLGGNDHVIEYNDISRVCLETGDAGAFYMGRNFTERGNVVRFNRFHDLGRSKSRGEFNEVISVYLDDCASGTRVEGNLFVRASWGAMIGGGRDNTIVNNVFVDCAPAVHVDERAKGWAKVHFESENSWNMSGLLAAMPYRKEPWRSRYPKLVNILREDPQAARGNSITRNICMGGKWLDLQDGLTEERAGIRGNFRDGDPGFVDAANGDYRLKKGAAPPKKGFKQLPFAKMGLFKDAYRKELPISK